MLNKLISDENKHRPVVIHGFSVGGYLYSHVLNLMVKQDRFSSVKERIRGQVLDSPVDFHGIPYGVSNAASENPFVRWLMKSSIEAYLAIFARYTTKVYLAHSHLFHNNPVRSPFTSLRTTKSLMWTRAKHAQITGRMNWTWLWVSNVSRVHRMFLTFTSTTRNILRRWRNFSGI